jgi:hypothetical protein
MHLFFSNSKIRWCHVFQSFEGRYYRYSAVKKSERLQLAPYDVDPGIYEVLDNVGQPGVGNLKSLRDFMINLKNNFFSPTNWEILARILPHIQKIELEIRGGHIEGTEEMRARASCCHAICSDLPWFILIIVKT